MSHPIKIGLVAGESSGDQLGSALIQALKKRFPDAIFVGIGGPKMIAEGVNSLFPMDRLSVMGIIDPLKRLPELLGIRKTLFRYFLEQQFDLVVGIDSPDFCLGLERKLRKRGITTAHYVSPSVWAWRQNRVKKIALSVDHMLTLFPFEAEFFRKHNIPVTCVGHPLADQIADQVDPLSARKVLNLPEQGPLIALLPGSRRSEVALMGRLFLQAASESCQTRNNLSFVVPAASDDRFRELQQLIAEFPQLPVKLVQGQSHLAMEAADLVILTSGTTALEAMLLKKPMVVGYRMGKLSYAIISRMVKTPFFSLPNLLAGKPLVPELLQDAVTVDALVSHIDEYLDNPEKNQELVDAFTRLHHQLRSNAAEKAAETLAGLIVNA